MGVRNLAIVIYCTLVAIAVLYAPQPLLPLLAEEWGRPLGERALLTTTTLVPLALEPLVYGYVLEHVSIKHMLILGFSVLTMAQFSLSFGPDYPLFFALRTLEGMVLPAILTALMTYSSSAGRPHKTRRNITNYIAATIAGGFSGRVLSGVMTDLFDWQAAFLFWAGAVLLATGLTTRLASAQFTVVLKALPCQMPSGPVNSGPVSVACKIPAVHTTALPEGQSGVKH